MTIGTPVVNKILTSLAAFTALTAAAAAADLPRRAAPPVFTPVPVFTWTGAYFGINAGYGFGTGNDSATTVVGVPRGATAASSLFVTGAGAPAAGVLAFNNRNSN